jgi:hypothetical protein
VGTISLTPGVYILNGTVEYDSGTTNGSDYLMMTWSSGTPYNTEWEKVERNSYASDFGGTGNLFNSLTIAVSPTVNTNYFLCAQRGRNTDGSTTLYFYSFRCSATRIA